MHEFYNEWRWVFAGISLLLTPFKLWLIVDWVRFRLWNGGHVCRGDARDPPVDRYGNPWCARERWERPSESVEALSIGRVRLPIWDVGGRGGD